MNNARKLSCIGAIGILSTAAACSDTVPPAAQGAASVHLTSSQLGMCSVIAHWINAPFDASNARMVQQTDINTKGLAGNGPLGIDGQNGVRVSCSVRANGSKFDVQGSIIAPVPGVVTPINVSISTTLGPNDTGATGKITVSDIQATVTALPRLCARCAGPCGPGTAVRLT